MTYSSKISALLLLFALSQISFAQRIKIDRVEPPFWWSGFENETLQLLVYGENISDFEPRIQHSQIKVLDVHSQSNPNYLFIDIQIPKSCPPQVIRIDLIKGKKSKSFQYEIKAREYANKETIGLNPSDLIYLIMPDRFCNGDKENDIIEKTREPYLDRDSMYYRHGGDLVGIENKLDYLQDLGVTALWLNPVQENDMPRTSYHGYAATDLYTIDCRLGSNEDYRRLTGSLHKREMKMVMDVVLNHWGIDHWIIQDLPDSSWIHHHDKFTRTNYKAPVLIDPHASEVDKNEFLNGWFDHHMPDLNQQDPFLAKYLIQNHIWWIEYAGIDAFRVDTYAYPDQAFMGEWAAAIKREFPGFFMFGETWVHRSTIQAYFVSGSGLNQKWDSNLESVTDFKLYFSILDALNEPFGWTEGVSKLHYTLAQDLLYPNPDLLVTFLDNHDLSRFYSMVKEDFDRFKMGVGFLMTMRGIPQIYYGTEILMKNYSDPDGLVREDFPGGWDEDKYNKFLPAGRTRAENQAFTYIRDLAHWRRNSDPIIKGKTMQFIPKDGVYVYFRYTDEESVMVILNPTDRIGNVDMNRYQERTKGYSSMKNILNDARAGLTGEFAIPPKTILIMELD